MRKILVAVAIAGLALAAMGPPAMARDEGVQLEKAYQVDSANAVSQDLAFTARAVYHPATEQAMDLKVSEKSAGKKKAGDEAKESTRKREARAAVPRYPLLL